MNTPTAQGAADMALTPEQKIRAKFDADLRAARDAVAESVRRVDLIEAEYDRLDLIEQAAAAVLEQRPTQKRTETWRQANAAMDRIATRKLGAYDKLHHDEQLLAELEDPATLENRLAGNNNRRNNNMASKTKLTTKAAIEKVLGNSDEPMRVPDIIKAAVPLTALSGKHPGQTVYSVIYSEAKKSNGLFEKVGKGTFKLRDGVTADAEPVEDVTDKPAADAAADDKPADEAKADEKPKPKRRRSTKKQEPAAA